MDLIDRILDEADIFDLLDRAGVKYLFKNKKHNISCPFHGRDTKPSMTVYPETHSLYCFFCDKSWDAISFWAEANEWWKEEGGAEPKLDLGRAIRDLAKLYSIDTTKPDWKLSLDKSLAAIRNSEKGYQGASIKERERLRAFYSFRVSRKLRSVETEAREELWPTVQSMWDELDQVDLTQATWKKDLAKWNKSANERIR